LNIYRWHCDHKKSPSSAGWCWSLSMAEELRLQPPFEHSQRQTAVLQSWWQTVPNWRLVEHKTLLSSWCSCQFGSDIMWYCYLSKFGELVINQSVMKIRN